MSVSIKFHLHATGQPRPGHGKRPPDDWHVCCQSIDEHRFDCTAAPADKRGAGPALPLATARRTG